MDNNKKTPDYLFYQKVHSESTSELIKRSKELVSKLCATGARSWTLSVPPSRQDPDMTFCELARRLELAEKALTELERVLPAVKTLVAENEPYFFETLLKGKGVATLNSLENSITKYSSNEPA